MSFPVDPKEFYTDDEWRMALRYEDRQLSGIRYAGGATPSATVDSDLSLISLLAGWKADYQRRLEFTPYQGVVNDLINMWPSHRRTILNSVLDRRDEPDTPAQGSTISATVNATIPWEWPDRVGYGQMRPMTGAAAETEIIQGVVVQFLATRYLRPQSGDFVDGPKLNTDGFPPFGGPSYDGEYEPPPVRGERTTYYKAETEIAMWEPSGSPGPGDYVPYPLVANSDGTVPTVGYPAAEAAAAFPVEWVSFYAPAGTPGVSRIDFNYTRVSATPGAPPAYYGSYAVAYDEDSQSYVVQYDTHITGERKGEWLDWITPGIVMDLKGVLVDADLAMLFYMLMPYLPRPAAKSALSPLKLNNYSFSFATSRGFE